MRRRASLASLLDRPVLPAETQAVLLERAGGNPLYAEEFARLLLDRGGLDADTPVPETVQALIAARIGSRTRSNEERPRASRMSRSATSTWAHAGSGRSVRSPLLRPTTGR